MTTAEKAASKALMPRKKPVQDRSKLKIESILEGAQKVLREKGVRAVTTYSIAAAAGANIGSIYQYFPNKEAIIQALYEQKLVNIRNKIAELSQALDTSDWKPAVYQFVLAVKHFEEQIGFDRSIIEATQYFDLLEGTWRAHSEQIARTVVELLKRLGSSWSDKALYDLALYIYSQSAATWSYWRLRKSEPDIGIHRQAVATVALFALAIESDTEAKSYAPMFDGRRTATSKPKSRRPR